MNATQTKKTKKQTSVFSAGTATSPPQAVSDPSVTTPAPATTAPLVSQTIAPPDFTMPVPPMGSRPVNFADYRGSYPKAGQAAAVPAVLIELANSASFLETFAPLVSEAGNLAEDLKHALGWTTLRASIETYLLYVRSEEAITWKEAKSDLESLDGVFQGAAAHNPQLLVEYPALSRLLDVEKQIAQRSAATRVAKAKANAANAAGAQPAAGAPAAPVVNPSAVTSGSGGVTH